MKHKVHYTQVARNDLDEVWSYIAYDLQNVSAAERTVDRIMDAIDRLADYPEIGPALTSIADVREDDYRFLVTGSYITLYRVSGDDVYVDRVLYGRRDYLSLLFGSLPDAEAGAFSRRLRLVLRAGAAGALRPAGPRPA